MARENAELFIELVAQLTDISERVIFLKNFDLFEPAPFQAAITASQLVLAGNLDKCNYNSNVLDKQWATTIYFSKPKEPAVDLPELPKYTGFLASQSQNGLVSLQ